MALRSCIACKAICEKSEMMRLVVQGNKVVVDESVKHLGRGAYVHKSFACIRKILDAKMLSHRLRLKGVNIDLSHLKDLLSSSVAR